MKEITGRRGKLGIHFGKTIDFGRESVIARKVCFKLSTFS